MYVLATDDMVQVYLIPAMKRGPLKMLAVRLDNIFSVESILRELPHTKVEELAIAIDQQNPYSEAVRPLYKCTCMYCTYTTSQEQMQLLSCFINYVVVHIFIQSHCSLVAATKVCLSESKTLTKFKMELEYGEMEWKYYDAFLIKCILTSIRSPLEELVLKGFDFHCECMHLCVFTHTVCWLMQWC